MTVTAIDPLGGVGTGYTSTIHFSSSDVQAGLPADYTFTAADAGVHTFTVTLKTAGSQFLERHRGRRHGHRRVVRQRHPGRGLRPHARRRRRLDRHRPPGHDRRPRRLRQHRHRLHGTVHFTSSDPRAVLPADTALVNGAATVNVTFMTVGTQTITATDVATPTHHRHDVQRRHPAGRPRCSRSRASRRPRPASPRRFTVTVRDTIGQVATGYTGTVFFSSSDVQAGLPASYTFTAADAGVHTFAATFRTAGTQSIIVRDFTGALTGSAGGDRRQPRPRSPASGSRSPSRPTATAITS